MITKSGVERKMENSKIGRNTKEILERRRGAFKAPLWKGVFVHFIIALLYSCFLVWPYVEIIYILYIIYIEILKFNKYICVYINDMTVYYYSSVMG